MQLFVGEAYRCFLGERLDAIATCLAEVFQDTRLVDTRRNEPRLAAFALAEDVSLLDLGGKWPTVARLQRRTE